MIVTVNSIDVTKGRIRIPLGGAWRADVEIVSDAVLSGPASIVVGDLTLAGTFVPGRGGVSAGVGRYLIRGALAWDVQLDPRAYQSDPGVRLLHVLTNLAKDIGEASRIVLPPDRALGSDYIRYGTGAGLTVRAADILTRLCPAWYVNPPGIVQCVPRAAGAVVATAEVLRRNLARRLRIVGTESPASFVPGLTFEGDTIGSVAISMSKAAAVLSVWGVTQ